MTLIEDVGMRNKGFRVFVVSLLFFVLAAVPAVAGGLLKGNGESSGISLYDPSGLRTDVGQEVLESGYIITTKSQSAIFTAPFGTFTLDPDSMMAVTDYDEQKPTLYLLDGSSSITVNGNAKLTLYTPTESFRLDAGSYAIEYTAETSIFTNLSENSVTLRDALRGRTYTVAAMSRVDLIGNTVEPILGKKSRSALEGKLTVRGVDYSYSINKGKAIVAYGFTLPSSEVKEFLSYLGKKDSSFEGIQYTIYPTSSEFNYPEEASNELALEYLGKAAEILDGYLGKFTVPGRPEVKAPTYSELYYSGTRTMYGITGEYRATKDGITITLPEEYLNEAGKFIHEVDRAANVTIGDDVYIARKNSAKGNLDYLDRLLGYLPAYLISMNEVVSGFRVVRGFTLNYVATMGMATLTYPEFVTDNDAEEFFIWAAGRRPEEAGYISYYKDDVPGKLELEYPAFASRSDIEMGADLLAAEIDAYAGKFRIPSAPELRPVRTVNIARVPMAPKVSVTTKVNNLEIKDNRAK